MPYTLHLMSLKCLKAQELGGDEIYIKLNGDVIFEWRNIEVNFSNVPNFPGQTDEFNFETCKYRGQDGWHETPDYQPGDFVYSGLESAVTLELWESDEGEFLRGDDDELGTTQINADAAGAGVQSLLFRYNGAEYGLSYRVTA